MSRMPHRWRRRPYLWVVTGLLLIVAMLAPTSALAQGEGVLTVDKTASSPGPYAPGDTFSYTVTISCANTTGLGCDNAAVSDTLPPPLVLDGANPVTVIGGVANTVDTSAGDAFTVDFTAGLEPGTTGLPAGQVVTITVDVRVPDDATAEQNGTLVNTATATADNATTVTGTASVTLDVPTTLDSTVTKDISPDGPLPALPGQQIDFTLGGANSSNTPVDSLVIQDPADGTADPFQYVELTGIASLTPPAGADTVRVDWQDAGGTWHTGTVTTPIPDDPNDLLAGLDLADVHGLRFTFSADGGTVPITPDGDEAEIVLNTQTRGNVTDIDPGDSVTINNTASSQVSLDGDASTPVTDDDSIVIERTPVAVDVDKSYETSNLTPGQSTTATVRATNSTTPVTEMVISDPAAGTPDFVDQGITFGGFTDAVEWPLNATGVSIQYTYDDGYTEGPKTSSTPNEIPDPTPGHRVTGYTITFTGPIEANAYANLPFTVTADPLPGDTSVTTTNTASSQVTASTGEQSDIATDDATLTRNPIRVSAGVGKSIGTDALPGVPGAGTTVNITGSVDDQGPDASTTGSEYLQITDPPNPSGTPSDFWNHFDATSFGPTDVPANADMTVEYWDGTQWVPLAGPIIGPDTWSYTPTGTEQDAIQGIRYTFTPKAGELLPPGFNVITHMNVEARDQLRDGTGSAVPGPDDDPITIHNDAESEVHNPNAVDPTDTATDGDDVTLDPVPSGPGIDTVDKGWLVDGSPQQTGATVVALTDDQRTARISWGTHLLPADTYAVTDPATAPANVANSVFDAFDLVRIEPITAATDPMMTFDAIASVELYEDGIGWVDITADACPTTAACDGQFAGYTLSPDQSAVALGVRVTYAESPTRAQRITSASDPQVGTGVARTAGNDRPLDLTFQLRQQRRSDPASAVLGEQHGYGYNTGQAGLVRNTVDGTLTYQGDTREATDDADIQILDRPVDVDVAKSFDQTQLPVPPSTTGQADYPLITATLDATNASVAKVRELALLDPSASQLTRPEPFRTLNLYKIGDITIPTGTTSTTVRLYRDWSTTPTSYPLATAQALTPADLADVTGIEILHDGLIESQATTRAELVFQLRATNRVTGTPPQASATPITNTAQGQATNPSDTATDTGDASFTLVEPTYGVTTGKAITPASRYENEANSYVVTLSGQPTGTVRTTELTLTDTTATFWNAFDFGGFVPVTLQSPIQQVKVDALVGVTYALQGGVLVPLCNGSTTLDACWGEGAWASASADGSITPALPAGVDAADVRGLRVSARNADGSQWERPINPQLLIPFDATQRATLRYGTGGDTTTPVPSDRPDLAPAPGETARGVTTDTVQVHSEGTWLTSPSGPVYTADDSATATTLLRHLSNEITVTKSPGNGSSTSPPTYSPGQSIPYVLTFTNSGDWPMTGLTLSDQIETDARGSKLVEPTDASGDPAPAYSFTLVGADGTAKSVAGFSASLNETTGLLSITVPAGFVFEPGDVLTVDAPLQFRAGLAPGNITSNAVTAASDRPFDTCHYTTDRTVDHQSTNVDGCTATTDVTPLPASPITVVKSVRGEGAGVAGAASGDAHYDDLGILTTGGQQPSTCDQPNAPNGYYRTPCVPITRPGGLERWQYTAQNVGNVPVHVVAGIDTLPRFGDKGVITGSARGSEWATTLVGDPTSNLDTVDGEAKTVHWYYTTTEPATACNAADILNETTPGGLAPSNACYADVTSRTWSEVTATTPEAQLEAAVAIKFVVSYDDLDAGLAPGATINLTMATRTAWWVDNGVSTDLPIAWNSIASGTQGVPGGGQDPVVSPVVEPTRVGVATATGQLALRKVVDAPTFDGIDLTSTYAFRVACTSGGEDVTLLDAAGNPADRVILQADGTLLTYNGGDDINLPLYAECTLTEDPAAQGATVTYSPPGAGGTSGSVTALHDQSDRDDIWNPAFPGTVPLGQITATNTYAVAGFTVSKSVDDGGAVDQDGDPITYDATYTFTASCTFQGQEAVPLADRTFTLQDGDQKTFDDLPAGSSCTVTETGTGGSASSTTVVTEGGTTGTATTGRSATFALGPDSGPTHVNAVAFTNHYTIGSMHLTKDVTGPGAATWGAGPFTVRLVCTLATADPTTVYDDTHTLTPPDDLDWTVDNLPTGAACTVTEPQSSGATHVTITGGSFTVGSDPASPAVVSVTNEFDIGSVQLTKEVYGSDADVENVLATGSFTFSLFCTRVVDGTTVNVTIPGGPDRTIDYAAGDASTVTWAGIPSGSSCTVNESQASPTPIYSTLLPRTFVVGDDSAGPIRIRAVNIFTPGWLVLHKEVTGDAAAYAPDDFTVHVSCERNGAPVTLPAGGTVVLPGNGSPVIVAPVPEGSQCHVTSEDAAGATDVDLGDTVTIPVFDPSGGTLPSASITVTNRYDATGFTVTKRVQGATDQDGDPIHYTDSYTFSDTCTFLGEEIIPVADQTFTLHQDETNTFTGLPVGAECTVTETDAGHADGTSVVVQQHGSTVTPGDGTDVSTGTFVLSAGGAGVTLDTFTNSYPVGAVTVTKKVTGAGAPRWGQGSFEARLRCTYDGAEPELVYDGTHALSASAPVWTVDTLPVGAHCTVTETRTGGATESDVSPVDGVTVPAHGTAAAQVMLTNTFDVGALHVRKRIVGSGAAELGGGRFVVTLTCTRDVDGAREAIQVPGGADRTLQRPDRLTVSYRGLPVGARCTLAETTAGGAEQTTIRPGAVIVGAGTPVRIVVTNRFDPGPPSALHAEGGTSLPDTGAPFDPWLVYLGFGMVGVGLTLILVQLRRR